MNSIELFKEYYNEQKIKIEKLLKDYNEKLIIEDNPLIKKNLEYFKDLNSDGKLVRGTLVNLGYSLEKDHDDYSNNLALTYEIFQTAILIHDDIIDNDEKRRGKDTIHYRNYQDYLSLINDKDELTGYSKSIALCMGDYGLYIANKVITESYTNDPNLGKVLNYFNDIVLKTIKGELLDVILPIQSKNNIKNDLLEENIIEIYRLKTAYYTIIGPLVTGLILAGASTEKQEIIEKFGEEVGIAFQIQDDILGIYSDETGKVIGSDIKEYKQTILYSYIQNTQYKEEFKKYYGQELTQENINKVRELLEISGATQYAINEMNKRYDKSIEILDSIGWIEFNKKEILKGFIEYLRKRNK